MKKNQMHIAFILPDLNGGGAQKMVANLANYYAQHGHKVDLVLFRNTGRYQNLINSKVNIYALNKTRALKAVPSLTSYLRQHAPDIVYSALYYTNLICLVSKSLAGSTSKMVISERNHLQSTLNNYTSWKKHLWLFLIYWLYPKADLIIGISNGVCGSLKKALPAHAHSKIKTIYNPVVTDDFKHDIEENRPDIFPEGAGYKFITSGRLTPQKDYPTLLQAFALHLQKYPSSYLAILGEGPLKPDLAELCKKLHIDKNVRFLGFVDAPLAYMKQAESFVITSRWEGFCNVIVEALYCRLNIIATNCPSGPAEILKHGQLGQLCAVGNYDEIADAMNNAHENKIPKEKLYHRALQFHVEAIAKELNRSIEFL
jgi:glycosyltransferase involved in cell wall biosynthesis